MLVFYAREVVCYHARGFGVVNSDLRDDGTVGQVRFFLSWQEARAAVGLGG